MALIEAIGFIPARMGSKRLPGKPLMDVHGKPLLQRVWEAACQSSHLRRIVVATDDNRIAEVCFNMGAEFVLTPSYLQSGTDRLIYAMEEIKEYSEYVLNIQGDEPLLNGYIIDNLVESLHKSDTNASTLIRRIEVQDEIFDPNTVKVITDMNNIALYFSRSPIPYLRDVDQTKWLASAKFFKHIGIYAYTYKTLLMFKSIAVSSLEKAEKLEQLRLLQKGLKIYCLETYADIHGVDTQEDLDKVREYFRNKKI